MAYDLDFEKPLAEIEQKILRARRKAEKLKPEEREQIEAWEAELHQKTKEIYSSLNSWQCVQVARHKDRPYTVDYIKLMCDDFFELRGDRRFSDDRAIQGGLAVLDGRTVMLMGNQKGRDTKERIECSFGMAHPEGFRKAMRLMQQAEKFDIPIVTLIDIAGAALDLGAEERDNRRPLGKTCW